MGSNCRRAASNATSSFTKHLMVLEMENTGLAARTTVKCVLSVAFAQGDAKLRMSCLEEVGDACSEDPMITLNRLERRVEKLERLVAEVKELEGVVANLSESQKEIRIWLDSFAQENRLQKLEGDVANLRIRLNNLEGDVANLGESMESADSYGSGSGSDSDSIW